MNHNRNITKIQSHTEERLPHAFVIKVVVDDNQFLLLVEVLREPFSRLFFQLLASFLPNFRGKGLRSLAREGRKMALLVLSGNIVKLVYFHSQSCFLPFPFQSLTRSRFSGTGNSYHDHQHLALPCHSFFFFFFFFFYKIF